MKALIVILMAFVVTDSTWPAPATPVSALCFEQMVNSMLEMLISPCGTPKPDTDSSEEAVLFKYTDSAAVGPRYIKEENCGAKSDNGLGVMRIRYSPLANGDCKVLGLSDWP